MVNLKLYKKLNNIPHFDMGADVFMQNGGPSWLTNNTSLNSLAAKSKSPDFLSKSVKGPSGTGVAAGVGTGLNIASSAVNFTGSVMNSFSKSSLDSVDTISTNAGTSNGSINGINYQKVNDIDSRAEMDKVNSENTSNTLSAVGSGAALGATVGSIVPGLGTVVGGAIGAIGGLVTGLFGSSSRKRAAQRRIYEAQLLQNRTNLLNRAGADTTGLQLDYIKLYGDPNTKIMYANRGKDIKMFKKINNRLKPAKRKGC